MAQTPTTDRHPRYNPVTGIVTHIDDELASEPGALDGYAIRCSVCGPRVITSTMLSSIVMLERQHHEWHEESK